MAKKQKHPYLIQFAKYMVGGGVYFWTGYAVFAICYSVLGIDWVLAKIAADVVGWTLNFLIQRFWAFAHPELGGKIVKVTGRYTVITLFNLALDYGIVSGLKHIGVTPYVGLFISSGFFTAWNYFWYKLWVFAPRSIKRRAK